MLLCEISVFWFTGFSLYFPFCSSMELQWFCLSEYIKTHSLHLLRVHILALVPKKKQNKKNPIAFKMVLLIFLPNKKRLTHSDCSLYSVINLSTLTLHLNELTNISPICLPFKWKKSGSIQVNRMFVAEIVFHQHKRRLGEKPKIIWKIKL